MATNYVFVKKRSLLSLIVFIEYQAASRHSLMATIFLAGLNSLRKMAFIIEMETIMTKTVIPKRVSHQILKYHTLQR